MCGPLCLRRESGSWWPAPCSPGALCHLARSRLPRCCRGHAATPPGSEEVVTFQKPVCQLVSSAGRSPSPPARGVCSGSSELSLTIVLTCDLCASLAWELVSVRPRPQGSEKPQSALGPGSGATVWTPGSTQAGTTRECRLATRHCLTQCHATVTATCCDSSGRPVLSRWPAWRVT